MNTCITNVEMQFISIFSDNPFHPLTIPSYGMAPWQFNEILVRAIETDTLVHHESRFTRVCGRNLLMLRPDKRTKSEYNMYSKMIVDRFPHFKHECSDKGNWVSRNGFMFKSSI